jgi:hypothetical protein
VRRQHAERVDFEQAALDDVCEAGEEERDVGGRFEQGTLGDASVEHVVPCVRVVLSVSARYGGLLLRAHHGRTGRGGGYVRMSRSCLAPYSARLNHLQKAARRVTFCARFSDGESRHPT